MSRLTMASMFSTSGKERLRKYHDPAHRSTEDPKATSSTERFSSTLLVLSFLASCISRVSPDALPLAP